MSKINTSKTRVYLSVELLKSLTKKELEGLTYFAENKYFNTDKDLRALIKPLKKHAFSEEKFSPEIQLKVFKAVFGDVASKQKELNKKQKDYLTNKLNALLRLAEEFLMIDYMKNKPDLKYELLYPQLINKKQNLLFNRHLKRDKKNLEQENKRGGDYYESQYKLQEALMIYHEKEGLFTKIDNFEELQYYLDLRYILNKQKYNLAQITLDTYVTKKNYDFSSYCAVESLMKLSKYGSNPLVEIYSLNINLLKNQDDQTYNLLLKKLGEENNKIPTKFFKTFYSNITNYCVLNIKKGKLEYHQKLFELYKQMHQNNLLLKNNQDINIRLLKNVISASCAVNQFEWANEILSIYNSYLSPQIRESVLNYNLGKISFEEGNYDKAHNHFIQVEKIDNVHDINVRILILKCIYEKEFSYSEATMQSFMSAKVFFKRNTFLTTSHKKGYINFIQILIELYKFKHQESKKSLEMLSEKLESLKHINNKDWLIEIINKLR